MRIESESLRRMRRIYWVHTFPANKDVMHCTRTFSPHYFIHNALWWMLLGMYSLQLLGMQTIAYSSAVSTLSNANENHLHLYTVHYSWLQRKRALTLRSRWMHSAYSRSRGGATQLAVYLHLLYVHLDYQPTSMCVIRTLDRVIECVCISEWMRMRAQSWCIPNATEVTHTHTHTLEMIQLNSGVRAMCLRLCVRT